MKEIHLSANELIAKLLTLSKTDRVSILDSCKVSNLGSHLLIAGIQPIDSFEIVNLPVDKTLSILDKTLSDKGLASFFTLSYDFGLRINGITPSKRNSANYQEPDLFFSLFDVLIIHDYRVGKTYLKGNENHFLRIEEDLRSAEPEISKNITGVTPARSNFTKEEYISNVNEIHEYIRDGETYQTNLTQQITGMLPNGMTPQYIFEKLRSSHPAPFSAFITREHDHIVSISPERFFSVIEDSISASPIKGTRPRGSSPKSDQKLRLELLASGKDRAENIMIVDLLRNDLGRVCDYGSVIVEELCNIEEHPTVFHLVSTISGKLRSEISPSSLIKSVFPCGSITGCPKIRTMEIIDQIETIPRGISMGAIGYSDFENRLDLNVAIRTMLIKDGQISFNVGGGIVIDSDPELEYKESLLKAKALLKSINGELR